MPGIKHVAERAGLSLATVWRALSGNANVSALAGLDGAGETRAADAEYPTRFVIRPSTAVPPVDTAPLHEPLKMRSRLWQA